VYGYFLNGGGACYVVRIGADGEQPTAKADLPSAKDKATGAFRIMALESGAGGDGITVDVAPATEASEDTFKLTVSRNGKDEEVYDNLSVKKGK
jgi:hypothetical protein